MGNYLIFTPPECTVEARQTYWLKVYVDDETFGVELCQGNAPDIEVVDAMWCSQEEVKLWVEEFMRWQYEA